MCGVVKEETVYGCKGCVEEGETEGRKEKGFGKEKEFRKEIVMELIITLWKRLTKVGLSCLFTGKGECGRRECEIKMESKVKFTLNLDKEVL